MSLPKQCLLFLLFILTPFFCFSQNWEISTLAPLAEGVSNNAVESAIVEGVPYVYSFSGIDSTKIYTGIHLKSWKYNTVTNVWTSIDPLPDNLGKIATGASRVDDIIYIIGGYNVFASGSETSSTKVHRFDVLTDSYLSDGAPLPLATDDHVQAVWRDSLIYVATGWSNSTNTSRVQIYNRTEDSWQSGTPVPNTNDYKSFGASGSIVGDTIYYFGGAGSFGSFGVQEHFRMGIINPEDPTEITWSIGTIANNAVGYRMGVTSVGKNMYWIGGSENTYNYNGVAYDGSGGVPPANRILSFNTTTSEANIENYDLIPMDLRGIASVNDTVKYIVGGMVENQEVSNQLLKLVWKGSNTTGNVNLSSADFNLALSPNPVDEFLKISITASKTLEAGVLLYDDLGELILNKEIQLGMGENAFQWETDQLSTGWYVVVLETSEGRIIKKLVVLR